MAHRKAHGGGGGGGHDGGGSMRWLLTYADLITLLMVFFVVLYSMARVDAEKYAVVAGALRRSFGGGGQGSVMLPLPGGAAGGAPAPLMATAAAAPAPVEVPDWVVTTGSTREPEIVFDPVADAASIGGLIAPPPPPEPVKLPEPAPVAPGPVAAAPPAPQPVPEKPAPALEAPPVAKPAPSSAAGLADARLVQAAAAIKQLPGPPGGVSVQMNEQGLALEIMASLLFDRGQAVLRPDAAVLLAPISVTLRDLPYSIMVHGTGEDGPGAAGNWTLAAQRSVSVIDFFIGQGKVPADRLLAVGYGGRSGGSRVTVVVMRPGGG